MTPPKPGRAAGHRVRLVRSIRWAACDRDPVQRVGRLPIGTTTTVPGAVLGEAARPRRAAPPERRASAGMATQAPCGPHPLDQGAPVSTYTVARELGHESEAMVRRVYAHLGTIRHRSEVVEFRVEQHLDRLGDRLRRLGLVQPSGTGNDTTLLANPDTKKPHNHGSDSGANDSDEWAWVELNYRPHAYQAH